MAREFGFTPDEWLDTDANIRSAMLKYLTLEVDAATDHKASTEKGGDEQW